MPNKKLRHTLQMTNDNSGGGGDGDASGTSPLHVTFEPTPTNPLIARPLSEKSKLCMVMRCACFGPKHSLYSNYLCYASDIAAVGTIFNSLIVTHCRNEI